MSGAFRYLTLALLAAALLGASVPDTNEGAGALSYTTHCAACHGAHMEGTGDGPNLRGIGMAKLDFYLTTGRMPAAVGWMQVEHRDERSGQQLGSEEIAAIERYLSPVVGGPGIPVVVSGADPAHGARLYATHCEHCHGAFGQGGSLGTDRWAPNLYRASITQVAEAVRSGPGEMPQFGEQQLAQRDLDDLSGYVLRLGMQRRPPMEPPFRSAGPVPEGAIGWLGVVALLSFVFTYWRSDAGERDREESVRRDAGERAP